MSLKKRNEMRLIVQSKEVGGIERQREGGRERRGRGWGKEIDDGSEVATEGRREVDSRKVWRQELRVSLRR